VDLQEVMRWTRGGERRFVIPVRGMRKDPVRDARAGAGGVGARADLETFARPQAQPGQRRVLRHGARRGRRLRVHLALHHVVQHALHARARVEHVGVGTEGVVDDGAEREPKLDVHALEAGQRGGVGSVGGGPVLALAKGKS